MNQSENQNQSSSYNGAMNSGQGRYQDRNSGQRRYRNQNHDSDYGTNSGRRQDDDDWY
jgi:hypothetical protein